MSAKYILDADGNPQLEPDLMAWGRWLEKAERRIEFTEIGEAHISTVFLGLDFGDGGPPILFETMIFWKGHDLDQDQDRYATRDEALAGHDAMVARVCNALA